MAQYVQSKFIIQSIFNTYWSQLKKHEIEISDFVAVYTPNGPYA